MDSYIKASSSSPSHSVPSVNVRRRRSFCCYALLTIPILTLLLVLFHKTDDNPGGGGGSFIGSTAALVLNDVDDDGGKVRIRVEDVLQGRYFARGFNGTWIDGTTFFYFTANGDLVTMQMPTGVVKILVSSQEFFEQLRSRPYKCQFSPSRKFVLVEYDPQKVYRHSTQSFYVVVDLGSRKFSPLGIDPESAAPESRSIEGSRRISLAKWAERSDSVVFVHKNDIYFVPDVEKMGAGNGGVRRITSDGERLVFNGVADWVYEEEMLNTNEAVWALNNETIAFIKFNDSMVDLIHFSFYGNLQYPYVEAIPYPKSGRPNPVATLHIFQNSIVKQLQFPDPVPKEHLIAVAKWTKKNGLLVQLLNRIQNSSFTLLCDVINCEIIHTAEQSAGWLDVKEILESPKGGHFFTIESRKQASLSYHHVIEFEANSIERIRSHGNYSIEKILHVSDGDDVYYMARGNLYRNRLCVTCELKCKSSEIVLATSETTKIAGTMYFVQTCLNGLDIVPVVSVYKTEPPTQLFTLETNSHLEKSLTNIAVPIEKRLKFKVNNYDVEVKLLLPWNFDEKKKYAVMVDVYGGPGNTKMSDRFAVDWGVSLVSSKGIIYASIDGRGSSGQSDDFMFEVYRRLGSVEIADQISGGAFLATLPYVDPTKIAIWGWSYGGFVTAMVMGRDVKNIYKCGISVAPVTNWGFYDTIYTERYLSTPMDNPVGYNESDVTLYVENFNHKKYFLVHGNADDNVHYQQSMYLSRALEMSNILFRQQSYPDENHGLGSVRPHLYRTLENFLFTECF